MDNIQFELPRPLVDAHKRPNTPPRPQPDPLTYSSDSYAPFCSWLCPGMVFTGNQAFYSPSFHSTSLSLESYARLRREGQIHPTPAQDSVRELSAVAASAHDGAAPYRIMLSRIFEPAQSELSSNSRQDNFILAEDSETEELDFTPLQTSELPTRSRIGYDPITGERIPLAVDSIARALNHPALQNPPRRTAPPRENTTQHWRRRESGTFASSVDWLARRLPPRQSELSGNESDSIASNNATNDGLSLWAQASTHQDPALTPLLEPPSLLEPTTRSSLTFDHDRSKCRQLKDQWDVKVIIEQVDWESGSINGVMEAQNVPRTPQAIKVCTHFSGEIVDGVNHGLFRPTSPWQSPADIERQNHVDQKYWAQLAPFAKFLGDKNSAKSGGKCPMFEFQGDRETHSLIKEGSWNYSQDGWILMRWKERNFVNLEASQSNLTIAGFYYIALSRKTGAVEGLYKDTISSHYQRLSLKPASCDDRLVFASYDIL